MADERKARDKAAAIIRESEGLRLVPYMCPAGYLTVGFGHRTARRVAISIQDANAWLQGDLNAAREAVGDDIAVKCNTNQLAALLSFVFNVGGYAFTKSTMRRMIAEGDWAGAALEFKRWNKATVNGVLVEMPGLTIRREAEATQFTCVRDL